MLIQVLWMGAVAGVIHFFLIGLLYGNPIVNRIYEEAQEKEAGVRKWPSKGNYLFTQFLGTQIEIYILTLVFLWLRPMIGWNGLTGALIFGVMLAAIRVYPRFWNMWIQSTYPRNLLKLEVVNGTIGTLAVASTLQMLSR